MIIDKIKKRGNKNIRHPKSQSDIPIGKWMKCEECGEIVYREDVRKNFSVCVNCGHYFRLSSRRRIWQTLDEDSFKPFDLDLKTVNPLQMDDYMTKLGNLQKVLGMDDAVLCGTGTINKENVVICVMDGNFMMGSMGSVVGEKITYSVEKAIELKLPLIIFSVSGGARMQEGIISLMQMAKTSSAIAKLNEAGGLFISVLTDPTYGGVTASFASLGDIILAEPNAMIGFAGKRVIKQTIGEELPDEFQTSEFLLEHGFVDSIVERKNMKDTLYKIIQYHKN